MVFYRKHGVVKYTWCSIVNMVFRLGTTVLYQVRNNSIMSGYEQLYYVRLGTTVLC